MLHCSDTRPDQDFTIQKLEACHRARGFGTWPGYHLYVRRDGTLYYCRPISKRGCHVLHFNSHSIGICYEGGRRNQPIPQPLSLRRGSLPKGSRSPEVDNLGARKKGGESPFEDNRTCEQMMVLDEVFRTLLKAYPGAKIVGHHELNPHKACPCLDPPASVEYKYLYK